jgi:hypothetical protein
MTCLGYLDYPFQNECFGHSSLAHFSYLPRLIFSKTPIFRTDDTCSQDNGNKVAGGFFL